MVNPKYKHFFSQVALKILKYKKFSIPPSTKNYFPTHIIFKIKWDLVRLQQKRFFGYIQLAILSSLTWLKSFMLENFSSSTWLNDQNDHLIIWSLINDHLIKLWSGPIYIYQVAAKIMSLPLFSQNDILYRTFSYNKIIFQRCSNTHYF